MLKSACPAESELLSWLEGTLDLSQEQTLAEHVEHCDNCEQRLQQLESQSRGIAGELRKAQSWEASKVSLPVTISMEQFQQQLIEGGFLSNSTPAEQLAAMNVTSAPVSTSSLAQQLVSQKILTLYQAEQFQLGKGYSLVLGNYVILDKIGAGGMGEVFKARHKRMDRLVAIKLLPAALKKQEDVIQRFHREVKAAAKLTHPNIVIAHDADEAPGGIHFLVMEYVSGRDLAHVLAAEKQLPVHRVLNYILQAAHGLAYAHENGVVHRDIKPANLLLDNKGVVKILDMCLARINDAAMQAAKDGLTKSGDVMGTVDYMAPEQAFDTHTVDGRADIYSLGCTLYRLLTGKNVYEAESIVQKLMAHQSKPLPSLRQARADVSLELDTLFQKMIAKRVEDRFQNMSAVILAMEAALASPEYALAKAGASNQSRAITQQVAGSSLQTGIVTTEDIAPTINLSNPLQATDPVSDRSISVAREVSSQPLLKKKAIGSSGRNRNKLIAAGAGGFLLVLLAIWVIIRNQEGNEIARVKLPEGSQAEIMSDDEATKTKPTNLGRQNWPADAPNTATDANYDFRNLIPLIKPAVGKDLNGVRRENDEIVVGHRADLPLPVELSGDYELRASFTVWDGPKYLRLKLPIAGRLPELVLYEADNEAGFMGTGVSGIDGLPAIDARNPTHSKERLVVPNAAQQLVVKVSSQGDQVTIFATLNEKPLVTWTGATNRLNAMPANAVTQPSFQVYKGWLKFHILEFKSVRSN
jgi:serine/threonine protein kinase